MKKNSSIIRRDNSKPYVFMEKLGYLRTVLVTGFFLIGYMALYAEDSTMSVTRKNSSSILLNNATGKQEISGHSEYTIDPKGELDLDLVRNDTSLQWHSTHSGRGIHLGYTADTVWTRFRVQFDSQAQDTFLLRLDYPSIDRIDLFVVDNHTGEVSHRATQGDRFVFSERIVPSHVFLFPISQRMGQDITIYLKTFTSASHSLPIAIFSIEKMYEEETNVYILFGFYFGLLLAMFSFNTVLFAYTKENTYKYYLLYLLSYFFLFFTGFGFANRYLFPDNIYLQNHLFIITVGINAVSSILFSLAFLKVKRYFKTFDRVSRIFIGIIFVWAVLFAITGHRSLYQFMALFNGVPLVSILIVAILLLKKSRFAIYFVVGWSFYLSFYVLSILRLFAILPSNFLTFYGIQIGSAVEMLILSMAIGHKLYEYKKRSDTALTENIFVKNQLNQQLTEAFEEKARALNLSLKVIQKDVEMARNIQLGTIPMGIDFQEYGLDIATLYLPKEQVSGDIYDIFQMDENKFRIFVADATGHGIQAGFFTMSIRTEYERVKREYSDPAQVIRLLNASVFKTFGKQTMLYTCAIIDIDLEQNFLVYASAGHPDQIFRNGDEWMALARRTHLIGFQPEMSVTSRSYPLNRDFQLLIFSDGIYEVFNEADEEYGIDQLFASFRKHSHLPGEQIIFNLFDEVNHYAKETGIGDDITVIYIGVKK